MNALDVVRVYTKFAIKALEQNIFVEAVIRR